LTEVKPKHKLDHFKRKTWVKLPIFRFIPACSPNEFLSQSGKAHTHRVSIIPGENSMLNYNSVARTQQK